MIFIIYTLSSNNRTDMIFIIYTLSSNNRTDMMFIIYTSSSNKPQLTSNLTLSVGHIVCTVLVRSGRVHGVD